MRKEIVFALIAGVVLGAIISFGLWRANTALKPDNSIISDQDKNQEITTPGELGITLISPEDNDVISVNSTLIAGITKPGAWVVISGEEEDEILKANEDGSFEQEVELIGGANQVIITAFDDSGDKTGKTVLVIHSTELESN